MEKKIKKKKSRLRIISEWLHLWLGLISGIIVFIVCFTASIWVFRDEINYLTHSEERIKKENRAFLPPNTIINIANDYFVKDLKISDHSITSIVYRKNTQTGYVGFQNNKDSIYQEVHFNPYSGKMLFLNNEKENKTNSFFTFIRAGHRFLWLPRNIGSPIVGSGCILFLITIITGLIWWYPKKWNESTRNKSFKIKWSAKWKRLNIDLHNVLGFYAFAFSFVLITTGISYSFNWFRHFSQLVITGQSKEEKFIDYKRLSENNSSTDTLNLFWTEVQKLSGRENEFVYLQIPENGTKNYKANLMQVYGKPSSSLLYEWNDTTKQLLVKNQKLSELDLRRQLFKINFELHVGNIYGLPTKILAFLTSIIGASLPVTGFIIWWNKRRKTTKTV